MKTGGPAFPAPSFIVPPDMKAEHIGRLGETQGMTLRDYFAAKALAGLSKDFRNATGISDNIRNMAKLNAELAYLVADAMIAARERES